MSILTGKLLTPIISPLGIATLLWLCAVFFRRRRPHLIWFGIILLWAFSTVPVASYIVRNLEDQYPILPITHLQEADCIVVLGGITDPSVSPRLHIEVNGGYDRLLHGMRLFQMGKSTWVILSGGTIPQIAGSEQTEAEQMYLLASEAGMPEEHMLQEGLSRNTYENALETSEIMRQRGWETALLVTSAMHMPRAVATFEQCGIKVFPASTDVQIVSRNYTWWDVIPTSWALHNSTKALKEYVGYMVYWLRGWV